MSSFIKRLVNRYINFVNFLTASVIICICLIVLMPAVHSALDTEIEHNNNNEDDTTTHNDNDNNGHQHHHHHHRIPAGEVLICAGFFVFHSIGLLVSGRKMDEQEPLLIGERKMSTVCCSSTRCPSGREIAETLRSSTGGGSGVLNSHEQMLDGAHMIYSTGQEDDCVLLLNQHHQHHTHNTHHEHTLPSSNGIMTSRTGGNYGSMGPDLVRNVIANDMDDGVKHSRIYVEEIKATSSMPDEYLIWPLSIKVGLFAIILAVSLVLFDFKIYGLMDALQVFRAASVGALLYIAFFLVLPKNPLGCGSCSKEKA